MPSENKGIVIKSTGSWYQVKPDNSDTVACKLKGKFRIKGIKTTNPIAVGDRVEFQMQDDGTGVINKIVPRKNYIIRKSTKLSKQAHIMAANIDEAILVATLAMPRTSTGFIDRFLVSAEAYHIPAKIIFNKNDIYSEEEKNQLEQLSSMYDKVGYPTLVTSAKTAENLDQIKALLDGKLSVISGHSGVGKSALLNVLVPGLNLRIGDISEVHLKGKHTTTFAELHQIWDNTYVVDTPGIKEFGLVDIEKDELRLYFPEMMRTSVNCKFYNCTHVHEPGCAVRVAVEAGEIASSRYENYLNMLKGDEMNLNQWELK